MGHLEIDTAAARLMEHFRKTLSLTVVHRILGLVTTGQVRHDAPHPHGAGGGGAGQHVEDIRVIPGADAVAVQTGVDLDGDHRG